jgi:hypothetical protein
MTSPFRSARKRLSSMDRTRKIALVAGLLYLFTFVTSIPALAMKDPVLKHADFVLGSGSSASVTWAAVLDVLCAIAGIGTAVVLYPVTRRQSAISALGFVTSRVIEAAVMFVGSMSLLAVVTLRDEPVGNATSMLSTAKSLVAVHDWTFVFGPGLAPAFSALLLGSVLYRSRLVPRIIPAVGLLGAPLLFAATTMSIFGIHEQVSVSAMLMALPIAAWEFSVGVWMTVKGFRPSPVTAELDATQPHALAA